MAKGHKREAAKRDLIPQWVWYAEIASIEVANNFLNAAEQTTRSRSAGHERFSERASCRECGGGPSAADLESSSCFTYL